MRSVLLFTALLVFQGAAASELDDMKALADTGDVSAQYNLGVMYDLGQGVPEDSVEAVKWYTKAANQGYAEAQYKMGVFYDKLAQTSSPRGLVEIDILAPHNSYSNKVHDDKKRKAKATEEFVRSAKVGNLIVILVAYGINLICTP